MLEKSGDQLKGFFGGWPTFIAIGTFLLYLTGYLSTRYYLTVVGVGADLSVLDEQYFFAGARFIVYLLSTIPILLMLIVVVAFLVWVVKWVVKKIFRSKQNGASEPRPSLITNVSSKVIAFIGIVIALVLIQFVMRKCFLLSNLLLAQRLPDIGFGLEQRLLDEDDVYTHFYFMSLVAGTIITASIWLFARNRPHDNWTARCLLYILGFLVLVQFLFLPINYGMFVLGRYLPRVADLGDQVPLPTGHKAWLVWEGTHTITYLVEESQPKPVESPTPTPTLTPTPTPKKKCKNAAAQSAPAPSPTASPVLQTATNAVQAPSPMPSPQPAPFGRKLISVPQEGLKQITILTYDPIMRHIFRR